MVNFPAYAMWSENPPGSGNRGSANSGHIDTAYLKRYAISINSSDRVCR